MATEREEKIEAILAEEFEKRQLESDEYLKSLESRMGATVAYMQSTSQLDAESEYWMGYIGTGGTIDDMNKDAGAMESQKAEEQSSEESQSQ